MKKKLFLVKTLIVLTVTALIPAWSTASEKDRWNGHLAGQASSPLVTDSVMGVKAAGESGKEQNTYGWNGHLGGQASSPLKTDLSVLPAAGPVGRGTRNGYLEGSLSIWQKEL